MACAGAGGAMGFGSHLELSDCAAIEERALVRREIIESGKHHDLSRVTRAHRQVATLEALPDGRLQVLRLRNCGRAVGEPACAALAARASALRSLELSGAYRLYDSMLAPMLATAGVALEELRLQSAAELTPAVREDGSHSRPAAVSTLFSPACGDTGNLALGLPGPNKMP